MSPAPTTNLPQWLTDEALQQSLSDVQSQIKEQKLTPPSSALDMSQRVQSEYLDRPLRRGLNSSTAMSPGRTAATAMTPREQGDKRVDFRGQRIEDAATDESFAGQLFRVLGMGPIGAAFGKGGPGAEWLGLNSPEEQQKEAQERVDDASQAVRDVNAANERAQRTRDQMKQLTDELGFSEELAGEADRAEAVAQDAAVLAEAEKNRQAAEEALLDPSKWPTQTKTLNMLQTGFRSAAQTALSLPKSLAIAWELTSGRILNGGDIERSAAREWIDSVDKGIQNLLPGDKARSQDFLTELSAGVGSMAGFLVAGYVGTAFGLPGAAASGALGAAAGSTEMYQDAERFNATGLQKYIAFIAGAGLGVMEAAPIDRMFFRAEVATGGLVSRMLQTTQAGSLTEFMQEFTQAVGQDVVARLTYDENRELDPEKWARQGLIGAIVGGGTGAVVGAVGAPEQQSAQTDAEAVLGTVFDTLQEKFNKSVRATPVGVLQSEATTESLQSEATTESLQSGAATETVAPEAATETVAPGAATETVAPEVAAERAAAVEADLVSAELPPDVRVVARPEGEPAGMPAMRIVGQERDEPTAGAQLPDVNMVRPEGAPGQLPLGMRASAEPVTVEDFNNPTPDLFERPGWAILTGTQEAIGPADAPENVQANQNLIAELELRGIPYMVVGGTYMGEPQGDSVLILADEETATEIGRGYQQESVLTNRGLVYGDGRVTPINPEMSIFGQDALSADFFSSTPSGAAFSLGLDFDATTEPTAPTPTPVQAVELTIEQTEAAPPNQRYANFVAERFANALPRPALVPPAEFTRGAGGSVPAVNSRGLVPLTHWSNEQRQTIDPGFAGTGPLRGEERGIGGPRVTYFGAFTDRVALPQRMPTKRYETLSAAEKTALNKLRKYGVKASQVKDRLRDRAVRELGMRGYAKEGGLGDIRHTVEVDPDRIYNIVEDPLGLHSRSTGATPQQRWAEYSQAIKDAGFAGYFNPRSRLGPVVALFDAVQPSRVVNDATGEVLLDNPPAELAQHAPQPVTEKLPGLPASSTGPIPAVVQAARAYAASIGLPFRRQAEYVKVDPERAKRIAAAYEAMEHAPNDPAVTAAYQAMIDETLAQYQFVKDTGLVVEAIEPGQDDPYAGDLKAVLRDIQSGHLWFFPTDQGFGTLTEAEADNPLLQPTDEYVGDRQLLANDVFRIVHDFFGHGIEGSGFGARGEENAWQSHMRLYTEAALPAVTSETRGQNSWVNYGPYGEQNRKDPENTVFAEQKTGIMPEWTWREGVAEDLVETPDTLAATASRGSLPAEQKRPQSGVAGQTSAANDDVRLAQISQNFIAALDLTVRQGRFTLKGKDVLGQFSRRSGVVRLRTHNDLSTLVHEGAHAYEAALTADGNPLMASFMRNFDAELQAVAKELYGGDTNTMPRDVVRAEGFAELFRVYTLNRAFADRKYPALTPALTKLIESTSPGLSAQLETIGQQFSVWLQLPSAQIVRNMVVSGEKATGLNAVIEDLREQGSSMWLRDVGRSALSTTINRYAGLNRLVADVLNVADASRKPIDLKAADDPRVLVRLARNAGGRAHVQITDGVMGYRSTTPTSRGLREALLRYHGRDADQNLSAIDPERQKDFAAYLISLRGLDEYRRLEEGKIKRPPLNATKGDLLITVDEMHAKYGADFAEAAKIVNEYGMAMWEKAYHAGLIDKKSYKEGLDRQFYAPLQRDMSDRSKDGARPSRAFEGGTPFRTFRGSDRDIIDPMDALMGKTYALEEAIAQNDAIKALAKLSDRVGMAGEYIERIPAQQLIGSQFSVEEVARQLTRDDTLTDADAQDLMTILESAIDAQSTLALFRQQQAAKKGENIIFYREDGKLAAIQLIDGEIGADVINTLNAVGQENLHFLLEAMSYTTSGFRAAVTSWPDFLAVNFIRDQVSAWILTDVGYKPFATGLRGVGDELRQSDWARRYNAAMGVMGGMNVATLHDGRIRRDINALKSKGYLAQTFGSSSKLSGKGLKELAQGFARVVEVSETGTRLGIFKRAYERAKADGLSDWEAEIEASYTATDYIDFGLNGSRMLAARRLIPFLNAQLQGLYKMVRVLGGDEVRQRKGFLFALRSFFKDANNLPLSRREKQAIVTGRKAWLKMMSIGLISAALHFLFEDDPDYQDASEYLRTTGWVIPTGEGRIAYIPKPFELALIANFTERALEYASGDAEAKNRLLRGVALNLSPPTSPPLIGTLVEQVANHSFFTGAEIVPEHMRALAPELQYNRFTSAFAKDLGNITGWSPLRIDHAMSGMFASAYRDVSLMYNATDPDRPATDATDRPFTRRFVRDARRGATSSQDFWKQASMTQGLLRRAETTYKAYKDQGRDAAAQDFLETLDPQQRAYAVLNVEFKADAKRLNPHYRARQLATIVSGIRRELVTPTGVDDTSTKFSKPFKLTAWEKKQADIALAEIIRREVRNTLIMTGDPGWQNKRPLSTAETLALLREVSPKLASEYQRRVKKAKVYSERAVRQYWPEAENRLNRDGGRAFLKDLISVAKVMPQ